MATTSLSWRRRSQRMYMQSTRTTMKVRVSAGDLGGSYSRLRPVVIDSEYTKEQYGKLKRKIGTSTSLLSCYSVLHRARLVPAPVDVALL